MLAKIAWYKQRIRVMKPAELWYRVAESLYVFKSECQHWLPKKNPPKFKLTEFSFIAATSRLFELNEYFAVTNEQIATSDCYLGYEWQWNNSDLNWHLAPDTKRYWPIRFFSKIDYRQGNPIGDIRVVWEISRFHKQLQNVIIAAKSTSMLQRKKSAIFQHNLNQIRSWWSANPHMIGVHYVSSMECALRLIAITHIVDTIRDEVCNEDWQLFLKFIQEHANFIFHRLSLYSSAGNHTIAEATGLVYAGTLFPEFRNANRWRNRGVKLLNSELSRQINPDGGPLEQTIWYLKFIVELGLLAEKLLVRDASTLQVSPLQRLYHAKRLLNALWDSNSFRFEYGDTDYGYALSPALSVLGTNGSVETELSHFKDSGIQLFDFVLHLESLPRLKMLFLTNNLGMAPLFGHGHADCLSLCISLNNRPLLIDTGTFGYNIDNEWRKYFRSCHAHNTVSVNNLDQSQQLSNFQWSEDIVAETILKPAACDNNVYWCFARHEGFLRAKAIHYRAVLLNLQGEIVVWDFVKGCEKLDITANWHFATKLIKENNWFKTKNSGLNIRIRTSAITSELFNASHNPKAGWCSMAYGEKHGIDTLRFSEQGTGTVSLTTHFIFGKSHAADAWWETHINALRQLI